MKRFFKVLLWSTLGLFTVFLLVISIVIIVLLANPNDYKPKISQFIQEQTGRTLTIAGDIHFSFFPWLGIELGKTTLGNATGFEEPTFASLENATVRLKLFPLLYKKFEVDTVFINGMRLMLTRHPNGSTNWDDLVALLNRSKAENTTESTQTEFNINGIEVTHSYFTWDDQLTNNRYEMVDAHLRTAHFSLHQAFNAEFTSTINSDGKNPVQGRVAASALLTISPTQQKIENLQLKTVLQSDNILAGKQPLTLQTKLDAFINLSPLQTKLAIDSLLLQSLSSSGSIEITSGQITGEMKFAPFSPQTIAKEFNLPEPKLPNGKTFHQGQGSTRFYIDPQQGIKIEQLKFNLDNNQLFIPKAAIDLLNQIIDVENFSLQGYDSQIQGKVAIYNFLQQPSLRATVQLTNQNVSKLSPLLTSNLSLPSVVANQPLTLQTQLTTDLTDFTLRNTQAKLGKNQLNLSDVQLNLPKQTFHIKDISASVQANLIEQLTQTKIPSAVSFDTLQMTTQLQGNKNEFNVEQLQIKAGKSHFTADKLKINLEKQIATLNSLIIDSLDIQLKANTLQINNLLIQPQWSGTVQFTPFNPRKLLDKLALTSIIPDTTDPHTLEKIALSTKFTGNSSKIHFTDTSLQIDKSQLTGYLQVNQFNKPEILFSFDIDKLDVDPYLPPKKEQSKEIQPIELPIEIIRSLNINGQLNIGWLKMANVKMEQVNLQMTTKDGIVQFYPFNASLYGGKHEG